LGGLGLILPGVTRIQTRLTPLPAAELALVMAGAMIYHINWGGYQNQVTNMMLAAVLTFVAYGCWKLKPL
jgi:hypothetical protein